MLRRKTALWLLAGSMALALTGCSSTPSTKVTVVEHDAMVALGMLGGLDMQQDQEPTVHRLGAGDSLGRSMYVVYLAHFRAERDGTRVVGVPTTGSDE